jgi:tetratricopeptide (TPR) repeat protein
LRADASLREPVRSRALSLAEGHRDDPIAEGETLADRSRWEEAAAAYARGLAAKPEYNPRIWFEQAILRLVVRDAAGYRAACRYLLDVFRRNNDPVWVEFAAHAWALGSNGPAETAQALELAERRASVVHTAWSEQVMGQALYRAGRFAEADARLRASLDRDPGWDCHVLDWLVIAMANQRLGRPEEARRWLEWAENWVTTRLRGRPGGADRAVPENWHWRDGMILHLLLREAGALIREGPPELPDNPFAAP